MEFIDELERLIDRAIAAGVTRSNILSELELKAMAMREEGVDEP